MGRELKRSSVRTNNQYYMYTANAVAPDYQWEIENEYKPQTRAKQEVKKSAKEQFLQLVVPNLVMLLLVFGMGLTAVGQYVYIQNVSYNINQSKEELRIVAAENEKLKKQVAALGELETIEAYAINNMGMVKATHNDMMFLAQEETVNYVETTPVPAAEDTSVSAALTALLGVVE